jgi:chromosome segregation ATPase
MTPDRPTADAAINLQPWLAEIDALKQHIEAAEREAIAARESADRWRQLYTQEASQRRHDLETNRADVDRLKTELTRFKDVAQTPAAADQIAVEVAAIAEADLRDQLVAALAQRETLIHQVASLETDLALERAEHAKTRSDLTAALGDTVEVFARTKAKISQLAALPPQITPSQPEAGRSVPR